MKRLIVRLVQLCFPVFFVTALCVLGTVPEMENGSAVRVAVCAIDCVSDHDLAWIDSLSEHLSVVSGEAEVSTFIAGRDSELTNIYAETSKANAFDAVIILAGESNFGSRIVVRLSEEGIPAWSAWPMLPENIRGYVAPDDYEAGYLTAKAVFEQLDTGGKVVVLMGCPESLATGLREMGYDAALAEHPAIEVIEQAYARWSGEQAFKQMQSWFSRHQGGIEGIIAQNDDMPLGALNAMNTMEVSAYIPLVGIDRLPEAGSAVANSKMLLTLRHDARQEAFETMDMVLQHSNLLPQGLPREMERRVVSWQPIALNEFTSIR